MMKELVKVALPAIPDDLTTVAQTSSEAVCIAEILEVGRLWVCGLKKAKDKAHPISATVGSGSGMYLFEVRGLTQLFLMGASMLKKIALATGIDARISESQPEFKTVSEDAEWHARFVPAQHANAKLAEALAEAIPEGSKPSEAK